jgi:hypothetical protein
MVQSITKHLSENIWTYTWFAILGWLFIGWPIAAWLGRRRRRNTLRKLLGSTFVDEKSFVRWSMGIAVSDPAGEFAFADPKRSVLCAAADIVRAEFVVAEKSADTLTIETRNEALPRVRIPCYFRGASRLGEIGTRLAVMQSKAGSEDKPVSQEAVSIGAPTIEEAILKLTDAVTSLAEAVRHLRSPQ